MKEALRELDERLGGYGRYQKWVFFLACLPSALTGLAVVNQVFIALPLQYRCLVPTCEEDSNATYIEDFLNFTTPYEDSSNKWSSCYTYSHTTNETVKEICAPEEFDASRQEKCSEWIYDTSLFTSTIVTEFDLTCDRAWMQSLAGSLYMFGMPFGAVLLGDLADRIGRKKGLMISMMVLFVSEALGAVSVNFYMYLAMKFISGVGTIATFQNTFIVAMEAVSTEWRTFCGMIIKVPFALGETTVALFAYFIRNWRWLQFTLALPSFFLLSLWWVLPESIRWLLSKGRFEEAKAIIKKAAIMNKVEISEDIYESLMAGETDEKGEMMENKKKSRSALDLFTSPRMRNRTFCLMFVWIAITHNFYGLSSNSANFGGNIFVNFVAIMLIEVPSYIIAYMILDRLGRKGTLVLLSYLGGIACLIASTLNEDLTMVTVILSIGGKFCVAAAFAVVYIFTVEMFPTEYRSLGMGTCSMSARLGGIIAPFTAGLGVFYRPLPLIIFGVLAILCGCALLLLPETLGSELPQTLKESENFGTDQSLFYFTCCTRSKNNNKSNTSHEKPPAYEAVLTYEKQQPTN